MSVYLPNIYRLAFGCDSVVPESVAQAKAQAYVARTGKSIYVPGLGEISPAPLKATSTRSKTKSACE